MTQSPPEIVQWAGIVALLLAIWVAARGVSLDAIIRLIPSFFVLLVMLLIQVWIELRRRRG